MALSMSAQQLAIAQQILSLKNSYQTLAGQYSGSTIPSSVMSQLSNYHAQAIALSDQLTALGYSGVSPESESAASWAQTIYQQQQLANQASAGSSTIPTTGTTSSSSSAPASTGLGQWFGGVLSGIGSGINTVTGSTGQSRATVWIGILTPIILIVAVAAFIMHGLSVSIGGGRRRG